LYTKQCCSTYGEVDTTGRTQHTFYWNLLYFSASVRNLCYCWSA